MTGDPNVLHITSTPHMVNPCIWAREAPVVTSNPDQLTAIHPIAVRSGLGLGPWRFCLDPTHRIAPAHPSSFGNIEQRTGRLRGATQAYLLTASSLGPRPS